MAPLWAALALMTSTPQAFRPVLLVTPLHNGSRDHIGHHNASMYCTRAMADTAEWLLGHQGSHSVLRLLSTPVPLSFPGCDAVRGECLHGCRSVKDGVSAGG